MKFYVNQIHLWLKNNLPKRVINFSPNKVNVITGESGTGKSSIITIIDYCLLGSEAKLVEEVINENILWYGLSFHINGKEFFIARGRMEGQTVSSDIYFSSTGIVPIIPSVTINIADLRKILEQEFGIDNNITIPYGGRYLSAGQKVSYRYFLLFNTQSSNIILNPNVFFDYDLYDRDKYIEALDRIFDLAIGVDTVDNVIVKDKLTQIDKEILKLEKKKKLAEKEISEFSRQIMSLVKAAQEYDLIEQKLFTVEEALAQLKNLINNYQEDKITTDLSELDELYRQRRDIGRKIRNFRSFENEYKYYKETINKDVDSLAPISYLNENFNELIPIPEMKSFIVGLEEELSRIKVEISNKTPFSVNIKDEIVTLEKQLGEVSDKIKQFPIKIKDFESSISKFIFIGELKAKLAFYSKEWENEDYDSLIEVLNKEYEDLSQKLQDNDDKKAILIELLSDRIQSYVSSSTAIGDYKNFKAFLNTKKKILQLREPNSVSPSNIGSSSNHMFLHLFMLLGMHEHFIKENIAFVPQFLIIDQLSQPYYEEAKKQGKSEIEDNSDKSKLTHAFKMLNDFVELITNTLKDDFQIILLEHAPRTYWEDTKMKHFNLVEEFRNGNALINL